MAIDNQSILLKKVTSLFVGAHDFRKLATQAAELVTKELKAQNLIGAAIFRVHEQENSVYAYTYANKLRRFIDPLLPAKFSQFKISLSETGNLVVKTILANQVQQSQNLSDFSRGVLSEGITAKIQKIMRAKFCVSIPVRLKSGKVAGAILYVLNDAHLSGEQLVLFETFADQMGLAFSNILEFERLAAKYNNLTSRLISSEDDAPSIKFTLRVTPKENAKLERLAREKKRTKAEIIRDFLDKE